MLQNSFPEKCIITKIRLKATTTINRYTNLVPITDLVNLQSNGNNTMVFCLKVDKAEATVYTKIWKVSGTDFLNMMGGGLGLCLGFSLISTLFYVFDTCSQCSMVKALKISF